MRRGPRRDGHRKRRPGRRGPPGRLPAAPSGAPGRHGRAASLRVTQAGPAEVDAYETGRLQPDPGPTAAADLDFHQVKRDLVLAVDPSLYPAIEGSADSEVMFFLALSFGLEHDPPTAVERMVGFVEAAAGRHGIPTRSR